MCYIKLDKIDAAIKYANKSIQLDCNNVKAIRLLGYVFASIAKQNKDINSSNKACDYFLQALEIKEDEVNFNNYLRARKLSNLLEEIEKNKFKGNLLTYLHSKNILTSFENFISLNNTNSNRIIPKEIQCPISLVY